MERPRIYVDFNEMLEPDLVLLSKEHSKPDSDGNLVQLYAGKLVHVYMDDPDINGQPNNLIADGVMEPLPVTKKDCPAIWCCRIDSAGIRHEFEVKSQDT